MEQVTTKQIETRVKRQVVVTEDGQVVDDSGPQVTTRTTEDTETKREEHTEVKNKTKQTWALKRDRFPENHETNFFFGKPEKGN